MTLWHDSGITVAGMTLRHHSLSLVTPLRCARRSGPLSCRVLFTEIGVQKFRLGAVL